MDPDIFVHFGVLAWKSTKKPSRSVRGASLTHLFSWPRSLLLGPSGSGDARGRATGSPVLWANGSSRQPTGPVVLLFVLPGMRSSFGSGQTNGMFAQELKLTVRFALRGLWDGVTQSKRAKGRREDGRIILPRFLQKHKELTLRSSWPTPALADVRTSISHEDP